MSGESAPDGPGRPWWAVALGVGVVLIVIVAVSGALGRPDLPSANDPDQGVELPDRSEVEQRSGTGGCEQSECEIWRADLGGGRVLTTARFAVHERSGTLTVVDLADGAVAWQRALADGPTSELYADDQIIVVADPVDGGHGVHLSTFHTGTGRPGLDRTYDEWAAVSAIHRIRGELTVTSTPAEGEPTSSRLMLSLGDGDVRGLVTRPHTVIRWRRGLVVSVADEVIGLSDGGAATVEWRADGRLADVDLSGGRVLLRTPSDDYEVRAISSGARLWATPVDGPLEAQFIGTWVGLTSEAGIEVVDPEDGSMRFERRDVAPTARVAHLALERYTVVAWPVADGVELGVYARNGDEVVTRDIPGADPAAAWVTLAPVSGHPDRVQVVADAGRRSTWLALPSGEVVRESVDDDPRPWDRDFADGLLWRSRTDQLVLEGPAGSLAIEGMTDVVSVDPLLVHGPDGLARLDPGPLLGAGPGG
ncbi:MAG TPA: PQQ-binding-like beta-propeller repeat protein [Egicoccus sp.]|nr:PQQ-binding-like beta-propeller repeat protein [Egicoccus sp.]HSK23861.1 PQQ-binding-like beta-propeller repeat protein [Egicoccus sp.]